jgi:hypothetical protein
MPKRFEFPALHAVGAHISDTDMTAVHTMTPPAGARRLVAQALDENVRFRLDGGDPSTSVGFQLKAGDPPLEIMVPTNVVLKMIGEAPGAILEYMWAQ